MQPEQPQAQLQLHLLLLQQQEALLQQQEALLQQQEALLQQQELQQQEALLASMLAPLPLQQHQQEQLPPLRISDLLNSCIWETAPWQQHNSSGAQAAAAQAAAPAAEQCTSDLFSPLGPLWLDGLAPPASTPAAAAAAAGATGELKRARFSMRTSCSLLADRDAGKKCRWACVEAAWHAAALARPGCAYRRYSSAARRTPYASSSSAAGGTDHDQLTLDHLPAGLAWT